MHGPIVRIISLVVQQSRGPQDANPIDLLSIILTLNGRKNLRVLRNSSANELLSALPLLDCEFVPRVGLGHPVTTTGVALQTPRMSMRFASTARHCRRIMFNVKHIFCDYILYRGKDLQNSLRDVPR
jgi:hypothetical protein